MPDFRIARGGATYFTNEFPPTLPNLSDFLAASINIRVFIYESSNSGIAVEALLSIRATSGNNRFGMRLPALHTYSYGAGASGKSSNKRWGFTGGAGWGYFQQSARLSTPFAQV